MSEPVPSARLWPTDQSLVPVWADGGEQNEGLRLRSSGHGGYGWSMVHTRTMAVKVTHIHVHHQERSHQHCLQHLQWQIIQHLYSHRAIADSRLHHRCATRDVYSFQSLSRSHENDDIHKTGSFFRYAAIVRPITSYSEHAHKIWWCSSM